MGTIDIEGKKYFSKKTIFADLFNYLLHDGRQIIDPAKLEEADTTEFAIPVGNGARVPVQKYRDIIKKWVAMKDDNAYYVLLGAEIQAKTHYAMPVKKGLYDMLGYASQVESARDSYKCKKKTDEAVLVTEDDAEKIKLTSEEFLSGFRKEDKLIPIITATIFVSDEEWDGPLDLHDMLNVEDKNLLRFIPNCPINLIAPANMGDEEFSRFSTDLKTAMQALKYQKGGLVELLMDTNHRKIDRDTAVFIDKVTSFHLDFEEKEDFVDVCKAVEDFKLKSQITGYIDSMREFDQSDDVIIEKVMNKYNVTKEYVLDLLDLQKA